MELGLWVARFVCTALLFLLGFCAPGIRRYVMVEDAEQTQV